MSPAIATDGLTRRFPGDVGVVDLTIDVEPGEVLALLGPNGAGKTTTVRLLNGVLAADAGRATVLGFDPTTQGEQLRARTGVLTEHAGTDDRLTARENLTFSGRLRGMEPTLLERRVDELLDRFGMSERADRLVRGSSTGQRKRLGLARALLHDPDVLFLDEPTSGLDPAATRDVIELIGALASEHGRAIVLCTHFLPEAGRLADRMAILDHGRLLAFGRPDVLAAELWDGIETDVDLGGPAAPEVVTSLHEVAGVIHAAATESGVLARVVDRSVVPQLVRAIVDGGGSVFAATPRVPTLEDVYFEIESRRLAAPGARTSSSIGAATGTPTSDERRPPASDETAPPEGRRAASAEAAQGEHP